MGPVGCMVFRSLVGSWSRLHIASLVVRRLVIPANVVYAKAITAYLLLVTGLRTFLVVLPHSTSAKLLLHLPQLCNHGTKTQFQHHNLFPKQHLTLVSRLRHSTRDAQTTTHSANRP